jgi:hypothetical protein
MIITTIPFAIGEINGSSSKWILEILFGMMTLGRRLQ